MPPTWTTPLRQKYSSLFYLHLPSWPARSRTAVRAEALVAAHRILRTNPLHGPERTFHPVVHVGVPPAHKWEDCGLSHSKHWLERSCPSLLAHQTLSPQPHSHWRAARAITHPPRNLPIGSSALAGLHLRISVNVVDLLGTLSLPSREGCLLVQRIQLSSELLGPNGASILQQKPEEIEDPHNTFRRRTQLLRRSSIRSCSMKRCRESRALFCDSSEILWKYICRNKIVMRGNC